MIPVAPKAPVSDSVEPTTIGSPDGGTIDGEPAGADPDGDAAAGVALGDGLDDAAGEQPAMTAARRAADARTLVDRMFTLRPPPGPDSPVGTYVSPSATVEADDSASAL
jgi:hypothetical protein